MQKKIAIIGSGKLATALVSGFITSGYHPAYICVIVRTDTKSDLSFFERSGVLVTNDIGFANTAEHILLAVTPQGSGDVLDRLSTVDFSIMKECEIISFISGLQADSIRKVLPNLRSIRVMQATCNTNIKSGNGIIYIDGSSEILSRLGKVFPARAHWVRKAVLTVGSANALHFQMFILGYEVSEQKPSVFNWLTGLLQEVEQYPFYGRENSSHSEIFHYMRALASGYEELLKYPRTKAQSIVLLTIKSAISAIIAEGSLITIDSILKLQSTVVTKGGSTEKGVNKLNSLTEAGSKKYLIYEVLNPINERMLMFVNEARESAKKTLAKRKVA